MRKLLVLLLFLVAAPFLIAILLFGSVAYEANRHVSYPSGYAVDPNGAPQGVPMPPGYPMHESAPYPAIWATWAKLLVIAMIGGTVLIGAVLIAALVFRRKPPAASDELSGGVEQLTAGLERMDARIGNLETILIERRR